MKDFQGPRQTFNPLGGHLERIPLFVSNLSNFILGLGCN